MALDLKQVEHIAKLARLGITDQEKKKFQKELSAILEFVQKLNQVETDKIDPMAYAIGAKNVMRQDAGQAKLKEETDLIINLFSDKKDRQAKVKAIL